MHSAHKLSLILCYFATISSAVLLTGVNFFAHSAEGIARPTLLYNTTDRLTIRDCAEIAYRSGSSSFQRIKIPISDTVIEIKCYATSANASPLPFLKPEIGHVVGRCKTWEDKRCMGKTEYVIEHDIKPDKMVKAKGFNGKNATTPEECMKAVMKFNWEAANFSNHDKPLATAFSWNFKPERKGLYKTKCRALESIQSITHVKATSVGFLMSPRSMSSDFVRDLTVNCKALLKHAYTVDTINMCSTFRYTRPRKDAWTSL